MDAAHGQPRQRQYLYPRRAVRLWLLPQPQSVHSVTNKVSPARDRHSTAGPIRALQQRRAQEVTREYAHEYARRAGIEGTISQGVRRCGMRHSRYRGLARTHLGHVLTAAALNFVRVAHWLAGTPRSRTRHSAFARVMAQL